LVGVSATPGASTSTPGSELRKPGGDVSDEEQRTSRPEKHPPKSKKKPARLTVWNHERITKTRATAVEALSHDVMVCGRMWHPARRLEREREGQP
jgi:hypothetical protein